MMKCWKDLWLLAAGCVANCNYRQLRISRIFWAAENTSNYPKFDLSDFIIIYSKKSGPEKKIDLSEDSTYKLRNIRSCLYFRLTSYFLDVKILILDSKGSVDIIFQMPPNQYILIDTKLAWHLRKYYLQMVLYENENFHINKKQPISTWVSNIDTFFSDL